MVLIEGGKGNEVQALREAAHELAEARIEFAKTFILAKQSWKGLQPLTDRMAHEMSVSATQDAITLAQAEYEIALHVLRASQ